MSDVPACPPDYWAAKDTYTEVPIKVDGPVAEWAEGVLGPYGYLWTQVNEWRYVGGDLPFAQFVCQRADGGRDWVTVNYPPAPPVQLDQHPFTRML